MDPFHIEKYQYFDSAGACIQDFRGWRVLPRGDQLGAGLGIMQCCPWKLGGFRPAKEPLKGTGSMEAAKLESGSEMRSFGGIRLWTEIDNDSSEQERSSIAELEEHPLFLLDNEVRMWFLPWETNWRSYVGESAL